MGNLHEFASNNDFMLNQPLSAACSDQGSDSYLGSDDDRSNWSARVNTAQRFEDSHSKHKSKIPTLDLNNLPSDSDEYDDE